MSDVEPKERRIRQTLISQGFWPGDRGYVPLVSALLGPNSVSGVLIEFGFDQAASGNLINALERALGATP